MNFIKIWDWFERPILHPRPGAQERELRELIMLYHNSRNMKEVDPEGYIATLIQAKERAEAIQEPWYALFFDFWCCSTLVFQVRDLNRAREMATKLVVESRKPIYKDCPVLGWVYLTLMDVHMKIDPIGYAATIFESLEYLENEVPIEYDTYCILEGRRSAMAFYDDRVEEALAIAESYLARSEYSNYRKIHANLMLCTFNYELGKEEMALIHAEYAENFARLRQRIRSAIESVAWQALLHFKRGNETNGHRLYRQAAARMGEHDFTPWLSYAKIVGEYHELNAQPEKAVALFDLTLEGVIGTGQHFDECHCRLERCCLLGRMGMPFDQELEAAFASTKQLLEPTFMIEKLNRVKNGDFSSRFCDKKG